MVCSPDSDPNFNIVTGILQEDTLASYLFIICLNCVIQMSIDLIKQNGFTLKKTRSRIYPVEIITDADYADDLVLLANTSGQAESL